MNIGETFKTLGRKASDRGMKIGCRVAAAAVHHLDKPKGTEEPQEQYQMSLPEHPGDKHQWRHINSDLYDRGRHAPIEEAPNVEMERPTVMVPGFRSTADCFHNWANTLTRDGNNGGRWYLMEDNAMFDSNNLDQPVLFPHPEAKVFVTRFEGNVQPPDEAGRQLGEFIERVTEATGHEKVDLASFSMGGLTSRSHLDQAEDPKVGKLIQFGTPNNGSQLGRIATNYLEQRPDKYGDPTNYEARRVTPRDLEAARWLQPVESGNSNLEALNSRWDDQRAKVEGFMVVGSDSERTLSPGMRFKPGDGVVHKDSLALPGEEPVLLDRSLGLSHDGLVSSPQGFQKAQEFLGWQIADSQAGQSSTPKRKGEARPHYQQQSLF